MVLAHKYHNIDGIMALELYGSFDPSCLPCGMYGFML